MTEDPRHKLQKIDIQLTPAVFYSLLKLLEQDQDPKMVANKAAVEAARERRDSNREYLDKMATMLKTTGIRRYSDDEDDYEVSGGESFLHLVRDIYGAFDVGQRFLEDVFVAIGPVQTVRIGSDVDGGKGMRFSSVEDMQRFSMEVTLNSAAINNYTSALAASQDGPGVMTELAAMVVERCDSYMKRLRKRHASGVEIHRDAIITDIAHTIYENIDKDGEIQSGRTAKTVSAYSMRKAQMLVDIAKSPLVEPFVLGGAQMHTFSTFVSENLGVLHKLAIEVAEAWRPRYAALRNIAVNMPTPMRRDDRLFQGYQDSLLALDPSDIEQVPSTKLKTADERFLAKFENETIAKIVALLEDKRVKGAEVVKYVLERKEELRKYFQEVNSFYVCRMSSGGFAQTPGMLEVVPGVRPTAKIADIMGGGVDRVVSFLDEMESSRSWASLFLATSPSGSADKANVLLVGPQGCGKSEILRAVGASKDSIGVFAQGSDFLTCWSGEAQKNPKRLFEGAMKLQKESGKQIFILIDEVDAVLNTDNSFGRTNLTTEFQMLMDGIVRYPSIAVWAATNHPERIPVPMVRRFNKVLVIGELSLEDRVTLLKHYVSFMPTDGIGEKHWIEAAELLNGAVGDVIRKVADDLWRRKMAAFVKSAPELAKQLSTEFPVHESGNVSEQRAHIHKAMPPSARVTPEDLLSAVKAHLASTAIQTEILTAVATYNRARTMLAGIPEST